MIPTTTRSEPVEADVRPITGAYLILAHANPEQLVRLVGSLPESSPVTVHFDLRADASLYKRSVE
jgi:hypothetical protein